MNPDGSFSIANVPSDIGLIKVRFTGNSDGTTISGASNFFAPVPGGAVTVEEIQLALVAPVPTSLSIIASDAELQAAEQTTHLAAECALPDGSVTDCTSRDTGTTYTASNPAICTVSESGLVTAVSGGSCVITAVNQGVVATAVINVALGDDADGDGLPDDFEAANGLDPEDPSDAALNADGDGLTNLDEYELGTDLNQPDTDGDGLSDAEERDLGTFPTLPDSDLDGLVDGDEVAFGSDPLDSDSDDDGLPRDGGATLGQPLLGGPAGGRRWG